jgi:hypothetical protein
MPGGIRPNKKLNKLLYALLKTPHSLQQKDEKEATKKQKEAWFKDSSTAQ